MGAWHPGLCSFHVVTNHSCWLSSHTDRQYVVQGSVLYSDCLSLSSGRGDGGHAGGDGRHQHAGWQSDGETNQRHHREARSPGGTGSQVSGPGSDPQHSTP